MKQCKTRLGLRLSNYRRVMLKILRCGNSLSTSRWQNLSVCTPAVASSAVHVSTAAQFMLPAEVVVARRAVCGARARACGGPIHGGRAAAAARMCAEREGCGARELAVAWRTQVEDVQVVQVHRRVRAAAVDEERLLHHVRAVPLARFGHIAGHLGLGPLYPLLCERRGEAQGWW